MTWTLSHVLAFWIGTPLAILFIAWRHGMLALSRKDGERVIINHGEIVVTVLEIRPDRVRLGFDAPKDVDVNREEVELRIEQQKASV